MFNPVKFKITAARNLHFVSDTHFCHNKEFLYGKRGFSDIDEHDAKIVEEWNNVVAPDDTVIHLGDFLVGAGDQSTFKAEYFLKSLNGHKVLLWGNHNAGVKSIYKKEVEKRFGRNDIEVYPLKINENVTFVGNNLLAHIIVDPAPKMTSPTNYFVFCSHFAHRIWIDGNKGVLHACGHSHSSDPESNPDFLKAKRLDVGIENFGRPISFYEFKEIMDKKEHKILDHHTEEINPSF